MTHFKLNCLTIIQRCVVVAAFNFRMMHEEILSSIFGCYETISFSSIEPFDCTFTHLKLLYIVGE